jgi:hypothetical protein
MPGYDPGAAVLAKARRSERFQTILQALEEAGPLVRSSRWFDRILEDIGVIRHPDLAPALRKLLEAELPGDVRDKAEAYLAEIEAVGAPSH